MDREQLAGVLRLHRMWRYGKDGGKRADLTRADLSGADLSGAFLSGVDLTGADLTGAVLTRAVLSGAFLTGAVLTGADLSGAVLTRAVLTGAVLTGAFLTGAVLSGAVLSGVVIAEGVTSTAVPHRRATRADGYEFLLWRTDQGWRIRAGCRFFSLDEARAHWSKSRPTSTPLGAETDDILAMFERHIARAEAA